MAVLGEKLWSPDAARIERAGVTQFTHWLERNRDLQLAGYSELWQWSIGDLDGFWRALWEYFDVSSPVAPTIGLAEPSMPGAIWFPGTRVNYARAMLDAGPDEAIALIAYSELREPLEMDRAELRRQVYCVARALRAAGVEPGDRVAAYLPNTPEAVVAMLAVTGIGAIWSSCSPDFGVGSALDRFRQIQPKVLFTVDGYRYGGRGFDRRAQIDEMLRALPDVEQVIHLPYLEPISDWRPTVVGRAGGALRFEEVIGGLFAGDDDPLCAHLPFEHPLWIVYSSGTTGLPKGMVHSHGGVLLEHLKSTHIHLGLGPQSRLFFYTTTGWIMFNVLASALLAGSAVVLYDGNPGWPDDSTLWRIAQDSKATNFGTSPTFVSALAQRGAVPRQQFDLSALDGVLCTGSPLTPESFSWIYDNVKSDLWVSSISGGTDVACGFIGGVPTLPVHSGELQVPCLGVDVRALDPAGNSVTQAEGELVIMQPMPSMPLHFWNDADGSRYRRAYFEQYPGRWRHGDLLHVTARGTYVIAGRSDSTLNRHGVRMGTSEIYRTVEADDAVRDSIVVHLDGLDGPDRLVLFVVLAEGVQLDDELTARLRSNLRRERSPRHVPEDIIAVPDIPYTLTGKKMEVPVKRILQGAEPTSVSNADAMRNPESLSVYAAAAARFGNA
jgi:acetoacetyl-CoA synthetase